MKKIISFLLIFCISITILVSASAEGPRRISSITPMLTFSGTTANCRLSISASNQSISCTLTLYEGSTVIASWSSSGSNYIMISESTSVQSGHTYTLTGTASVNGSPITIVPLTKTCP